ncbi:MAG TPA: histidine kinase [Bacteroidales bacterium]|nr:histidine kinase [Bacteroidales bacterium]
MYSIVFSSFGKRLVFALLAGISGALMLEVVFGLQYRNYSLFLSWQTYLAAIGLAVVFTEMVRMLNKYLDRHASWDQRPERRLIMQVLAFWLAGLLVFSALRLGLIYLFKLRPFILLSDELTIALFIITVILVLNIIDFGVILLNQWRYSLAEAEKYRKESAEFEFEMLRAQINPHFLFNSLNTLSSLVYEDPDKSAEFIRKLSDVYRHVLDSRQKEVVTLREELAFTESYIFLLMLRFDNKLEVAVNLQDELLERKVAPLTLQLLIENAVKHNIISERKPLRINIYYDGGYIVVENPFQPKPAEEKSSRMGLRNISSRYRAISGKEVIINNENNKFTVKIPIK